MIQTSVLIVYYRKLNLVIINSRVYEYLKSIIPQISSVVLSRESPSVDMGHGVCTSRTCPHSIGCLCGISKAIEFESVKRFKLVTLRSVVSFSDTY